MDDIKCDEVSGVWPVVGVVEVDVAGRRRSGGKYGWVGRDRVHGPIEAEVFLSGEIGDAGGGDELDGAGGVDIEDCDAEGLVGGVGVEFEGEVEVVLVGGGLEGWVGEVNGGKVGVGKLALAEGDRGGGKG